MKKIIVNIIACVLFCSSGVILAELIPYIVGDLPTAKEAAGTIPPVVIYNACLHVAWTLLFITGCVFSGRTIGLLFDRAMKNDKRA